MNGGPVLFWAKEDPFSSFYYAPINIDGRAYLTVEHFYQSQKFTGAPDIREAVIRAPDAAEAKKISRAHQDRVRPGWDQIKEDVMWKAVTAKFTQHADLRRLLLETTGRELIENSPTDPYWGKTPGGEGLNRLGVLLMKLRDELKAKG